MLTFQIQKQGHEKTLIGSLQSKWKKALKTMSKTSTNSMGIALSTIMILGTLAILLFNNMQNPQIPKQRNLKSGDAAELRPPSTPQAKKTPWDDDGIVKPPFVDGAASTQTGQPQIAAAPPQPSTFRHDPYPEAPPSPQPQPQQNAESPSLSDEESPSICTDAPDSFAAHDQQFYNAATPLPVAASSSQLPQEHQPHDQQQLPLLYAPAQLLPPTAMIPGQAATSPISQLLSLQQIMVESMPQGSISPRDLHELETSAAQILQMDQGNDEQWTVLVERQRKLVRIFGKQFQAAQPTSPVRFDFKLISDGNCAGQDERRMIAIGPARGYGDYFYEYIRLLFLADAKPRKMKESKVGSRRYGKVKWKNKVHDYLRLWLRQSFGVNCVCKCEPLDDSDSKFECYAEFIPNEASSMVLPLPVSPPHVQTSSPSAGAATQLQPSHGPGLDGEDSSAPGLAQSIPKLNVLFNTKFESDKDSLSVNCLSFECDDQRWDTLLSEKLEEDMFKFISTQEMARHAVASVRGGNICGKKQVEYIIKMKMYEAFQFPKASGFQCTCKEADYDAPSGIGTFEYGCGRRVLKQLQLMFKLTPTQTSHRKKMHCELIPIECTENEYLVMQSCFREIKTLERESKRVDWATVIRGKVTSVCNKRLRSCRVKCEMVEDEDNVWKCDVHHSVYS